MTSTDHPTSGPSEAPDGTRERPIRVYVPANRATYEPTDDPEWWQDIAECTETCGHPVHAFNRPQRLRHIEAASVIRDEGVPVEG